MRQHWLLGMLQQVRTPLHLPGPSNNNSSSLRELAFFHTTVRTSKKGALAGGLLWSLFLAKCLL